MRIKMGMFDWMDKVLGIKPSASANPDSAQVRYLLRFCTTKDLLKIAADYISADGNPKVKDKDSGLMRKPTREELERSIIARVPAEILIEIVPKLKKKLEEINPDNN